MIETLVMPLPSYAAKAIIDIAVVLGELFLLVITMHCHCTIGGLLYPFAFSLTIPVSCVIITPCTV